MAKPKKRKQKRIDVVIDGKTVKKAINYYTLEEYEEKKKKVIEAANRANNTTFKKIAEDWQSKHTETIGIYTENCYRRPIADCIEEFGSCSIGEITPEMVQGFLTELYEKKYAKQTINLRKIVMKQIFDYAIFKGIIYNNPVTVCKVPRNAVKTERSLPEDDAVEKIKKNKNGLFGLFCNILLYTGMRREEALALSYEDIDFKKEEIRVGKTVIFDGNNGILIDGTKSKAGKRTVPLLAPLKKILPKKRKGYLFYIDDRPIKRHEFNKGLKKYKDEIGAEFTCHQLRHWFCTLCLDANLDEADLKNIMGHSRVSLSKDIYTHIRASRQEQSKKKLNDLFNTAANQQ